MDISSIIDAKFNFRGREKTVKCFIRGSRIYPGSTRAVVRIDRRTKKRVVVEDKVFFNQSSTRSIVGRLRKLLTIASKKLRKDRSNSKLRREYTSLKNRASAYLNLMKAENSACNQALIDHENDNSTDQEKGFGPIKQGLYWSSSDGPISSYNLLDISDGKKSQIWRSLSAVRFGSINWDNNTAYLQGLSDKSKILKASLDGSDVALFLDLKEVVGKVPQELGSNQGIREVQIDMNGIIYFLSTGTRQISEDQKEFAWSIHRYDASSQSISTILTDKDFYTKYPTSVNGWGLTIDSMVLSSDDELLVSYMHADSEGRGTLYRIDLNNNQISEVISNLNKFDGFKISKVPTMDLTLILEGVAPSENPQIPDYQSKQRTFIYSSKTKSITEVTFSLQGTLKDQFPLFEANQVGYFVPKVFLWLENGDLFKAYGSWWGPTEIDSNGSKILKTTGTGSHITINTTTGEATLERDQSACDKDVAKCESDGGYLAYQFASFSVESPNKNKMYSVRESGLVTVRDRIRNKTFDLFGAQLYGTIGPVTPHKEVNKVIGYKFTKDRINDLDRRADRLRNHAGPLTTFDMDVMEFYNQESKVEYRPLDDSYYWLKYTDYVNGEEVYELVKAKSDNIANYTTVISGITRSNMVNLLFWLDKKSGNVWFLDKNLLSAYELNPTNGQYQRKSFNSGSERLMSYNPIIDENTSRMFYIKDDNCLHYLASDDIAQAPEKLVCFDTTVPSAQLIYKGLVMNGKLILHLQSEGLIIKTLSSEEQNILFDKNSDTFITLKDFDGFNSIDKTPDSFMILNYQTKCASGKLVPGVCGCDAPDNDVDFDGLIDCKDPDGGAGTNPYVPQ